MNNLFIIGLKIADIYFIKLKLDNRF